MAKAEGDKGAETKANARAKARIRAVARTKASEAMAKTSEDEVAEATKDDLADAGDEAMSKTNHAEAVETREDARIEMEQTEIKEDDVAVKIHNFQKLGTEQLESNTVAASSFLDTLQAIAAEASDYSRWSLENRSSFLAKLLRRDDFRERHSDPVGTCQDVLRGLHCLFDEIDRTPSRPRQRVFQADRNSGRQGSGRQRIGYVDLLGRRLLRA
jgi:hypothetical protein